MEYTIKCYHGCYYRNRNGTRKLIDIARGDNCVCATVNPFWRPVKLKYLRGRHYDTRSWRKNFKKEIRDQYRNVVRKMIYDSIAKRLGTDFLIHKDKIKIDMTGIHDRNNPEGTILSESGLTVQDKDGIFHPVFVKDHSTLFLEPQ